MSKYTILGETIELSITGKLSPSWKRFQCDREEAGESTLRITEVSHPVMAHQGLHYVLDFPGKQFLQVGESMAVVDTTWSRCQVLQRGRAEDLQEMFIHVFYAHFARRQFIQVHSSLVSCCGKGIMFLGPSGIGKTTQAELWQKYHNATIINGDLVFVQRRGDTFLGWGTPWHGSSPYCENTNVPLAAWVVLKQSRQNTLRRLSGFELVSEIGQNIFYPLWLEQGTEMCMETLDALLKKLPVYELSCRPEEAAVEMLYNELYKNNTLVN